MKISKFKILATSIIATLIVSCTGNFEEINTNPNTITVGGVKAHTMFEPILYGCADSWQKYTWFWNNELIQFTAFTGGTTREEHRYFISDANWKSVWNKYASLANNASHMYDLSTEQNNQTFKAIAITMKVLLMSNLTDMFGDIPYSEAFLGRKGGTKKPKFDSQQEVYEQMFTELEEANAIYGSNPVMDNDKTSLDGMYGGDMKKWQKFNNSLYLRLLCRVSGRSVMNTGTKMTEILAKPETYPVFESNDDNAVINFSGIVPYVNYFDKHDLTGFTSGGRKLTEQFFKLTLITDKNGNEVYYDPRLPIIGKKADVDYWKGTIAGCTVNEQSKADNGSSWLNNDVFCRPEAPTWFMDYAELQFIFAEATLKGYISGGESVARNYYNKAITASLEKWDKLGQYCKTEISFTPTDVVKFLASDLASWEDAANKEELIANQKYMALFWTGMEAYHEYRRTGYPILTIGEGTFNKHILPTRFAYPNTTIATNSDNANEALTRMRGDNNMQTPVWWSKQAIEEGN